MKKSLMLIIITFLFIGNSFSSQVPNSSSAGSRECKVRVNVENADGTHTEYEVTFSELSWWRCAEVRLGAWWDRNF